MAINIEYINMYTPCILLKDHELSAILLVRLSACLSVFIPDWLFACLSVSLTACLLRYASSICLFMSELMQLLILPCTVCEKMRQRGRRLSTCPHMSWQEK